MKDPKTTLQAVSNGFLVLLATHLALGEVLGRMGHAVPPSRYLWNTLILEPMVTTGLVAIAVFYAVLVRDPRKRILWLVAGLALELLFESDRTAFHGPTWEHKLTWGAGLGFAGLLGLVWEILRNPTLRPEAWLYLKLAGIPPLAKAGTGWITIMQQEASPKVADNLGYAFESAWGFQPSVLLGRLVYWSSSTYGFFTLVYVALSFLISVALLAWLRSGRRLDFEPFSAFALCGFVGTQFYAALPMVGPQIYLGDLFLHGTCPLYPNHLNWVEAPTEFQRNCYPSLHAAWIYLVGAVLWPLGRRARALAAFLVLTTLVASAGYGTHYILDFVAAVPLYYGTRSICSGLRPRNLILGGLQFLLIWGMAQAVLNIGAILALHPRLPLLLQIAVIGLSYLLFRLGQGFGRGRALAEPSPTARPSAGPQSADPGAIQPESALLLDS